MAAPPAGELLRPLGEALAEELAGALGDRLVSERCETRVGLDEPRDLLGLTIERVVVEVAPPVDALR
ncbi:MAG TPA: hypothetical protein VKW77_00960, partial [Acidimicrobiales bacterium]|nr:hypothetical protein [Acidimicrobiales bacterium]